MKPRQITTQHPVFYRQPFLQHRALFALVILLLWAAMPVFAQNSPAGSCDLPTGSSAYDAYLQRGDTARTQGDFAGAVTAYGCAIQVNPNDAQAYNSRGKVLVDNMGDPLKAGADFTEAIRLDPTNAQYYNRRGWARLQSNKASLAIMDFEEAVKLKPDYGLAYNNMGLAYLRTSAYQRAVVVLSKATELDVQSGGLSPAAPWANLGLAYVGAGDVANAKISYEMALKLDPEMANIYLYVGNMYFDIDNFDQAAANYRQYVDKAGDSADPVAVERLKNLDTGSGISMLPILFGLGVLIILVMGTVLVLQQRRWNRVQSAAARPPTAAVPEQKASQPGKTNPPPSAPAVPPAPDAAAKTDGGDTFDGTTPAASGTGAPAILILSVVALATGVLAYALNRQRKQE